MADRENVVDMPEMLVSEKKPEVKWAACCPRRRHGGFLLRVNGCWVMFTQNPTGGTSGDMSVGMCRSCTTRLNDQTEVTDWEWGVDNGIDKHLMEIVYELPKKKG